MMDVVNVSKSFPNNKSRVIVLDDVSFQVCEGEFFTILGPNGCGKTTLLRIIHGLLQPDKGMVLIRGEPVSLPPKGRYMVFQSHNLVPWKMIKNNIAMPLVFMKMDKTTIERKVRQVVDFVSLNGFENHYPSQLSGGMRQRAALARALVADPEILLLDEPLSALDAYTRELFQEEFLRILERTKTTIVYVTHSVDEAVVLSDRICILTPRPARVKDIITVDLPRPRSLSIKNTKKFLELRETVWSKLAH